MEVAAIRERIDEGQARCFVLDTHHLAMLDRFLARARRYAGGADLHFPGVTLEIDPTGGVSVAAAGLQPLVLAHPSVAMGDDVGPPLTPGVVQPVVAMCNPGHGGRIPRAHPGV
jgi:hypothetical protein